MKIQKLGPGIDNIDPRLISAKMFVRFREMLLPGGGSWYGLMDEYTVTRASVHQPFQTFETTGPIQLKFHMDTP